MPTHKIYSKYAGIGNDVLQTDRISLKAKGLLGYLVSKPGGWNFSTRRIANEIKEGRDSIIAGLKELESEGLVRREKLANGRVLYHVYSSYELLNEPESGNPTVGKPHRGKTPPISKQEIYKKRERGEKSLSQEFVESKVYADKYEVKLDAIEKAISKYFLFCKDNNKLPTRSGLELWLTREKWDHSDYSITKQNELTREALMQGFM